MTRNSQTFRIMLAISPALVLNVILFAEPFFHPHWQPGSSSAEKLMDSLSKPAGLFVDKFFPGHGDIQIVVLILSSLVLYTLIFWAILNVWGVIRDTRIVRPHAR